MNIKHKFRLSVWQTLSLGYLAVIFTGSILLILPFATKQGETTSYLNALFTSASAACVTGLVPYDTGTHWSLFGQIVLLLLIQTGGLGFMAFVSLVFGALKRGMGLYGKTAFMQSSGVGRLSEIKRLLRRMLIGTALFELLGAALLSFRFIPDFGFAKGIYFALWHSVSAFCNAGFDLLGGTFDGGKFVSFTHYASDPLVTLTLAFLIFVGGLGFCVWSDLIDHKGNLKKCTTYTKMILLVDALLLLVPTFLFFLFEHDAPAYASLSTGGKWLAAFFDSATPRTAGFNTVDMTELSNSSYMLTLILMFIGGGSGSTAGGIKIGTFTVIVMGMLATFRGKRDIDVGRKRIGSALINQALAIFGACLLLIIFSTLFICAVEPDNSAEFFARVLFETVSALGTVGLSLSLTPTLSAVSKIVLMLLMYAGRVGILTLALSLGESRNTSPEVKKPLENFLIG